MYKCDLHTHTTVSDGKDTYEELLLAAKNRGLNVVAITDHDKVPLNVIIVNGREISPVEYAKSLGVKLIPGIEYSCDTQIEDVHIVGLGCDFSYEGFEKANEDIKKGKIKSYRVFAEQVGIEWNKVVEACQGEENVQKKRIFELMAEAGMVQSWKEAKLMAQSNEKLKSIKREKISPKSAIELIHAAGGIAILAHPLLIDEKLPQGKTREEYIEEIIGFGIDGIEAAYPYSKTSYKGNLTDDEAESYIREKYEGRVKIMSGGSDYHNDARSGIVNGRELGEKGISQEYFDLNELLRKL